MGDQHILNLIRIYGVIYLNLNGYSFLYDYDMKLYNYD